jgi:3-oxoacyl-[acyl-carrier protein] reductase
MPSTSPAAPLTSLSHRLNLTGKRALVCGSTAGIGRACAIELASLGCEVTLLARDQGRLQDALALLPASAGQRHEAIAVDLSQPGSADIAVRPRLDPARPYHILVNNTGGPPAGTAIDASPEQLLAAFNAQLIAAHLLVRLLLPGFKSASYGRIINITSTSVKQPIPNLGISNIIRPAVAAWGKCLATELGPFGVTVNNVLPGYTETDRLRSIIATRAEKQGLEEAAVRSEITSTTPLGRFATPEEIAAVVAFLASPAGGYVSGVNVPVDGGRLGSL